VANRRPIIWSSDALADLSDIWDYYANVAGRHTADKIVREIEDACRILEDHPFAGRGWRDDERGGTLVRDEPIVVHCYTTPLEIEDGRNLAALGDFCRKLGRETRQGEIGLVVGDEYFAIRDFNEAAMT
jgi:plasmid stabilization system protein ParE